MRKLGFRSWGPIAGSIIATFAVTLATPLHAQVTGTISGYVTDPTGAAIPQAGVTATLVQQNITRTVESNTEGFYNFAALLPGVYTLSAEKEGFERLVRTGVTLTVNQNLRVDMSMKLGALAQQVTVSGEAPLVDTRSPTVSGLVDDQRIVDLPLNGRNIVSLSVTLPGVLSVSAPQYLSDARGGPTMNVNGGQFTMNNFLFDGGYFVNPSRNTGMNYPPPDAIQEFRIQTSNFSAEYGRNIGSQVSVVSKAGSNDFHGSAWEFLRNDALNARNFFSATVPGEKQNQFGGAAGGPIRRDKLFFFGSYQGLRDHPQAVANEVAVPSSRERSGDFTDLLPGTVLRDPVDPLTGKPLVDSSGVSCVNNNIINPNCISPVATNLLKYVPQSSTATVVTLGASPINDDMYMGRIDVNKSSKQSLFGHFYVDHNTSINPYPGSGNLAADTTGYIGETFVAETDMVTLNDNYTISPNLINQAVVSYLRTTSDQHETNSITPSQLGINMPQYIPTGAVDVGVSGSFDLGSGYNTRFINNNYQIRDVLNWMKGKHNFKFGGEYMRLHFIQRFIGSPGFSFDGSRSGDPVADFMLGSFVHLGLDFGLRDNDDIQTAPSFFFQDEYKIRPRFMLTYGIRYEPMLPWYDNHNKINALVFGAHSKVVPDAPPGFLFPGDPGVPRGLIPDDLNNFAPRIGFAWDVFGNGKTSVRGGYGVFYDSIKADSLSQENAPYAGFGNAYNGQFENPFSSVGQVTPPVVPSGKFGCIQIPQYPGYNCPLFPLPLAGVYINGNVRQPYVQSWNLTIERQLTPDIMVQASYVGKIGTKIEGWRDYNPAHFVNDPVTGDPPSLNNANDRVAYEPGILAPEGFMTGNDNRSWYHSLQVQVTKRMSRGLSVTGSYTLAKSIDMESFNVFGGVYADPFNLHNDRGRSDWDRRHAVVASWVWAPRLNFGTPWRNTLLGGWSVTGITTVQSGAPFTVVTGSDVMLVATSAAGGGFEYAERNGAPVTLSHPSRSAMVTQFFNTNAFVPLDLVPPGTIGDSGRNTISGPALSNTDFSIIKDFAVKERYKVQFRSEFFNVFNQVNFNNPNNSQASGPGVFGAILGASSGRQIQFGLKFLW
jgi:hypothetical protein